MGKRKRGQKYTYTQQQDFNMSRLFSPEIQEEIAQLFKKKFSYNSERQEIKLDTEEWTLPDSNSIFHADNQQWSDPMLQDLKTNLNAVKSKLSDFDITLWHAHTQSMNRAGGVQSHIKHRTRAELCTQAWCKFFEVANSYPIGPFTEAATKPKFSSLHICEAPGAFITSFNHYLQTNSYKGEWHWVGNTLNPYYEGTSLDIMIADDRFIYDTLADWFFGKDNTGDVMERANLNALINKVAHIGKFNLVTADGSIDCANVPGEQESMTAQLHYCELVTALHVLDHGGSLVMKMFTLLEANSVCVMYLLNCVFSQVDVFKPATSKSGNSEVYVIAHGYQGIQEDVLEKLTQMFGPSDPTSAMFRQIDIPASFLSLHQQCCQRFHDYQTQTIMTNLATFKDKDSKIADNDVKNNSKDYRIEDKEKNSFKDSESGDDNGKNNIKDYGNGANKFGRDRSGESRTEKDMKNNSKDYGRGDNNGKNNFKDYRKGENKFAGDRLGGNSKENEERENARQCCTNEYMRRYNVMHIRNDQRIVPTQRGSRRPPQPGTWGAHGGHRHCGSYTQRQELLALPWIQRLARINTLTLSTEEKQADQGWLHGPLDCDLSEIHTWTATVGKPFSTINNTKFCNPGLIDLYNEFLHKAKAVSLPTSHQPIPAESIQTAVVQLLGGGSSGNMHMVPSNEKEEGHNETSYLSYCVTLEDLITKLQSVEDGDCVVLPMPCPLSRFSAALIFILHTAFEKVKVLCSPSSYMVQLVAAGCQPKLLASILPWLQKLSTIQQKQAEHKEAARLLELVPVQWLYESNFHLYLRHITNFFLKSRINHLLEIEKQCLSVTDS